MKDVKFGDGKRLSFIDFLSVTSVCKLWRVIVTIIFDQCSHLICLLMKPFRNENKIENQDWAAGLPDHLVELVIERLPLVDCLSFSSACKGWKRITKIFFNKSSHGIPLLVKPGQSENIIRTCLNVFDKTKNSTFDIPMPEKYIGSYIWGSYRDWLFLVKPLKGYIDITLLNPFSGEKFVLPKTDDKYQMLVVSSVPSDPKCIYMIVRYFGVAFWTSGAREWRLTYCLCSKFEDALYHEGNFYLISSRYKMLIIDEKSVIDKLSTESGGHFELGTMYSLEFPGGYVSQFDSLYLVESCGDILLMRHVFYKDGRYVYDRGFETYRLNVSQMALVKLMSLGEDQVLFLGKSCSRSFHASELGGDALANKMYFSNKCFSSWRNEWKISSSPWDNNVDDWGVFSLQKESSWPRKCPASAKLWAGIWVTAPIGWCLSHC